MKKTIKSTRSNLVYDIERADWSVKFRTPENYYRHAERRVWISTVGFNLFVEYKGAFYMVGRTDEHGYITSIDFTEVSAEEAAEAEYNAARERAAKAQSAERATSDAAMDYDRATVEEQAREANFEAMAAKNSAEAARRYAEQAGTKEAFVFVEMALEEAERARQFAADARETAEKNAAEVAELKDVDAYANAANTCADSAEWAERKAEDATTAKSAAARAHQARVFAMFASEAADKARASLNYSIRTYFADYETSAYSAEAVRIRREHAADAQTAADRAEQAAQRAEAIAEQMSAVESEQADAAAKADAAADALTREYRAIVNDHPTTTPDPCTREAGAARRVARHDIAHELGSTREDRETVAYMVEAIALQAAEEAETAAAYAAFEANRREHIGEYLVKYEWSGEGLYRIAWSDGGQKSDPHHYETAEELAADLTSAYQHATETHQPYAERLEYYERAELLAYLGEPSDFDLEAIEAEATDTDEHGNRYWTADAEELEAIAQRNRR